MNLEDLRAAQVDERGTDSLQPLPATFYEQAADYLADLRERRDRLAERADDPFGSESVRQLTDELETAEEVVEALYERRVGKLIKQASLAAAGMPADDEGLTDEEQALFTELVEHLRANRSTVLGVLDEEGDPPEALLARGEAGQRGPAADRDGAPAASPEAAGGADSDASPTDGQPAEGGSTGADPAGGDGPDVDTGGAVQTMDEPVDRVTVRITAEVGEIYGVDDRVYTLDAEDVVTLPAANAQPLLDRGVATRVD